MEEFHGIIVNKSLKNESVVDTWNVIGKKKGNWVLYKVSVNEDDLNSFIKKLQSNMAKGAWYAHFYNKNGSKIIVVFKEKVFETSNNKENLNKIVQYGKSLGIPLEQLDFIPSTFTSETY